ESWILTHYDDVAVALRDQRLSVDRNGAISRCPVSAVRAQLDECNAAFDQWMVFSDAPRHTRLRERVAHSFTPARVRAMKPLIRDIAERLLAPLAHRPSFDLSREIAEPLPGHVTSALLGIPVDDIELLAARTDDVFAFFGAGIASEDCVRR